MVKIKTINWSQVAKEHNIPGSNCGQILKEFAAENGIDVFKRQPNTRARAKKLRMPGGEISVPTHRTEKGIKTDIENMINSGELCIGESCVPYSITKYSMTEGELNN